MLLELDDFRDVDGVAVDAVCPRPVDGRLDAAYALPDCTVALEPAPEPDLPDAVPPPHPPLRLDVVELVPTHSNTQENKNVN